MYLSRANMTRRSYTSTYCLASIRTMVVRATLIITTTEHMLPHVHKDANYTILCTGCAVTLMLKHASSPQKGLKGYLPFIEYRLRTDPVPSAPLAK